MARASEIAASPITSPLKYSGGTPARPAHPNEAVTSVLPVRSDDATTIARPHN